MPIAGERPESGVRIAIERPRGEDPPFVYTGAAHVPDASFPIRVTVTGDGSVDVAISPSDTGRAPSAELTEKVRLLVRTAYKQAKADGEPPAIRLQRWRGDK